MGRWRAGTEQTVTTDDPPLVIGGTGRTAAASPSAWAPGPRVPPGADTATAELSEATGRASDLEE